MGAANTTHAKGDQWPRVSCFQGSRTYVNDTQGGRMGVTGRIHPVSGDATKREGYARVNGM